MGFNFEILGPIVISDVDMLDEFIKELYKVEIYPLQIISDKNHEIFKNMHLPRNIKVEIIILPFRYLTKFLA